MAGLVGMGVMAACTSSRGAAPSTTAATAQADAKPSTPGGGAAAIQDVPLPPRGSVIAHAPSGKTWSVGLIQFASYLALNSAHDGAVQALLDNGFDGTANVRLDDQNAQGDIGTLNSIAQRFKDMNHDLVIALATPAYQAMLNVTKTDGKPPFVFNCIVDPYAAAKDIVKSPTEKPFNVTGLQSMPPVEDAMRLAQRCVPAANRVGIIWNPSEANSVVVTGIARETAPRFGFELVDQTVANSGEVLQAAQSLVTKGIDLFFVSADSTVVTSLEAIVQVANDNRKPLFSNDPFAAQRGASAALGVDYEQVGYESGQMAAMILSGHHKTSDLPIRLQSAGVLSINPGAAKSQGVSFPDDVVKAAKSDRQ
jgi:putative ABC transport system substrate-binding protein